MDISRRQFLHVSLSTGAMVMSVGLPGEVLATSSANQEGAGVLGHYLKIHPNNRIEIGSPVMDMGQHMKTTGPMMLAEELDADWALVDCVAAKTNLKRVGDKVDHKFVEESSGGSHATRNTMPYFRTAGATARTMLRQAAAKQWQCPLEDVATNAGFAIQKSSGRKSSYGSLAHIAATLAVPDAEVKLKEVSQFKIIGSDVVTVDIDQMVRGAPLYGQDMEVADMLHASIERCPYFQGRLKSFDDKAAAAVPGVVSIFAIDELRSPDGKTVITSDGVVVVANNLWTAMKARRLLSVEWNKGPWHEESSAAMISDYHALVSGDAEGDVKFETGEVHAEYAKAVKTFNHHYETPFLAHACMEPFNAIADVRESSATIISGHQNPAGVANAVAETLNIDPMSIEVISPRSGGGFGRRYSTDFVREAAVVSKKLKQAVKITWTREDEVSQDQFGPGLVSRIKAGIDKNGKLTSWHIRQAKKRGGLWAQCFPAHLIANYRAEVFRKDCGTPLGPWRGPGHLQLAFATESMIDEVAHFVGSDPLAYRMQLMGADRDFEYSDYGADKISSGRMAKCYQAAAKLADWDNARPKGVGLGIAGHFTFGSYAAFVVEVDSRDNSNYKITKAWGAIDCGMPVNPNHIRSQMEGGFIDGLNAAMFNEIKIEDGKVSNTNFHSLQWMRMAQSPRTIETTIVKNDYPSTGVGEPPTAPAAAALANAIFAATGQRLRKLPLTLKV